ncbi:MAG: NADH-quinone oxidoreductase subunit NuoH [Chloroflexi bacterium]|nr:NADH-quinone oxidoreductase subunit NuoH [Chloroflexota bacterium]
MWDTITNLLPLVGAALHDFLYGFLPGWLAYLLLGFIFIVILLVSILNTVLAFIWLERRGISRFQVRLGPDRVGPMGLLQPIADAVKLMTKEDIVPAGGDRAVHYLAAVLVFVPALLVFAVLPFAPGVVFADLNIGILYIIAIGSVGVIGVFMGGWASNNKYSLMGAMRAVAQMVSYEVPMVLSVIGVVMVAQSLSLEHIVQAQELPFILLQPLGFFIYFAAASAELNRTPMDLLEAESEIIAGYHVEYSGMKFALFFLAEYANALAVSIIVSTLFLGGWKLPLVPPYIALPLKIFAVFGLMLWIRSTLPRLRVDQLMGFAWKGLLPIALLNIFITGGELLIFKGYPSWLALVNIPLAALILFIWSRLFTIKIRATATSARPAPSARNV